MREIDIRSSFNDPGNFGNNTRVITVRHRTETEGDGLEWFTINGSNYSRKAVEELVMTLDLLLGDNDEDEE